MTRATAWARSTWVMLPLLAGACGRAPDALPPAAPIDVMTVREGALSASVAISEPALDVGEALGVVLAAEAPQGFDIELPPDTALAPFEVVRSEPLERRLGLGANSGEESLRVQRRVVVTTWEPGERALPALSFRFTRDGVEPTTIEVPERTITVASLIEDPFDPTTFDDLRSMPSTPAPRRWWPWAISGVLVLALAAFLLLRSRRRHPPAAPPDPESWAASALAALAAESLPARGEVEPYFTRLVDVLRDYLQQRLGLAAPDLTSEEFLRLASADPRFKPEQRASLDALLRFADLVKFARGAATRGECETAMGEVRAMVESMRPTPAGPVAPLAPGGTVR
jgi:hypothetical protein